MIAGSTEDAGCPEGMQAASRGLDCAGLCAWVTLPEFAASEHWVIRCVLDLRTRRDFDDFQSVELGCRVLFTLHDQHVFEALVVFGTVQCWAVAQTVELEAFQSFANCTWVERAGTLTASA